jgi:hypothetical protein
VWTNRNTIQVGSSLAPYLGDPWSKVGIGRVKDNGNEKWVGFIGGGFASGAPGAGMHTRQRFYVVDLSDEASLEYTGPRTLI